MPESEHDESRDREQERFLCKFGSLKQHHWSTREFHYFKRNGQPSATCIRHKAIAHAPKNVQKQTQTVSEVKRPPRVLVFALCLLCFYLGLSFHRVFWCLLCVCFVFILV
jgi:hypothetical protein